MNQTEQILVSIAGASIPAFIAGRMVKGRTKAETTDVITQAAERVVTQLLKALDEAEQTATRLGVELETQRATAERLEGEVTTLRSEIGRLRELVIELGGDPAIGRRRADV